jgi:hypothetical protein
MDRRSPSGMIERSSNNNIGIPEKTLVNFTLEAMIPANHRIAFFSKTQPGRDAGSIYLHTPYIYLWARIHFF